MMMRSYFLIVLGVIFYSALVEAGDSLPANSLQLKEDAGDADLARDIERLPKTQWIRLNGTNVTGAGFVHLKKLRDLSCVELERAQITETAIGCLKGLAKLERLRVDDCTDSDLIQIVRIENLRFLDLGYTRVGNEGLIHLGALPQLERLSLNNNFNVSDVGLSHLSNLMTLQELSLNHTKLTDKGVSDLAKLKNLERLDLGNTALTDKGMKILEQLTSLKELNISHTQVTDAGLEFLKDLENLGSLSLYRLKVTDAGLVHLEGLKKLYSLGLTGSDVTDQGIAQLRSKLQRRVMIWR
jgi:internalin A